MGSGYGGVEPNVSADQAENLAQAKDKISDATSPALILAGPILRKTEPHQVVLWLVTSAPCEFKPYFALQSDLTERIDYELKPQRITVSDQCYIYLLDCRFGALTQDTLIYYDIAVIQSATGEHFEQLNGLMPDLYYEGQRALSFFIPKQINSLYFGSCRNFHHPSKDTLVVADKYLAKHHDDLATRPCLLIHGGDQVYTDDVGGPTLQAIHQLIKVLSIEGEHLPDDVTHHSDCIHDNMDIFYQRQNILPKVTFKSKRLFYRILPFRRTVPVFSSVKADNHLVTLAEMVGLYLFAWSPECWRLVERATYNLPANLTKAQQTRYQFELTAIDDFIKGLSSVRRLMAHVPNYMIFDDHDVTDDWNLTAQWEDNVYSNPLSKRVISNAMLAYWLFQGWGNEPDDFSPEFVSQVETVVTTQDKQAANELEQALLNFNDWHYIIERDPNIIVLDTRTHRWRSERSQKNPSGLLDWERLVELENVLVNKEAGIIVSAAPIFGVKLIETIQRVFTFFGGELVVDAENWMAHRGSAKKLLQIFGRRDTPDEIVVLSGDVHYSFCFKIKQRFKENATEIWQLTCSGFKNEFPLKLISCFDWLERRLYFPASPLNIFTKRRGLEIEPYPVRHAKKQILLSKSSIGLAEFDNNKLKRFRVLVDGDGEGEDEQKGFL